MLKPWKIRALWAPELEGEGDAGNQGGGGPGTGGGAADPGTPAPAAALPAGRGGLLRSAPAAAVAAGASDTNDALPNGQVPGKRPDSIPEKFWDAATGAPRVEQLAKSYAELETAHARLKQGKNVPESAEAYTANGEQWWTETTSKADRWQIGDGLKDPMIQDAITAAHEVEMPVEMFRSFMAKYMTRSNERLPEPFNEAAEKAALGKNADAIVTEMNVWVDSLHSNGRYSQEEAEVFRDIGTTAIGVRALSKMREDMGEKPMPIVAPQTGGAMSASDWYDQQRTAMLAKDYAKQEHLDRIRDEIWPEGMPPMRGAPEPRDVPKGLTNGRTR